MNLSPQQTRILEILSDGEEHGVMEIANKAGSDYPPRRIWELRKMGFKFENRLENVNGVKRSWWKQIKEPEQLRII